MVFYNKNNSKVVLPVHAIPGSIEYRIVKKHNILMSLFPSIAYQIKIQA